MTPTSVLQTAILTELGADTTMLAGDLYLFPIKTGFSPGPDPGLTDADLADFDGSAAIHAAAATRAVLVDPATGMQYIRVPDPVGGWQWTCSGDTNLPQTIHGIALSSDSTTIEGGVLLATAQLDPTYSLTVPGAGLSFGVGEVDFALVLPALQ